MDSQQFEGIVEQCIDHICSNLHHKGIEYNPIGDDRLHAFRVAAHFNDQTMEQALWGMLTKHLVSLSDMIQSEESQPMPAWDEKIGDALTYLVLLRAVVVDTQL